MPGWDFDAMRQVAQTRWNENLSRITVESSNPNIRQTFYTAMYHTMLAPTLYNNADGSYRGADQKVHAGEGFQYYSTFSLWDTFRAEHPLLTLVQPERVNGFVRSLLAFDAQSDRHPGVDATGQALDQAGTQHQLVTDDFGVGRSFLERG